MSWLTGSDENEALTLIARIDEMLDGGDYDWAEETLTGIRETVERARRATPRQQQAVDNIENRGAR